MAHAVQWIAAVLPEEIVRQRQLGWPDFHPEDFCHRCGRRNPIWWTEQQVWLDATAERAKRTGNEGIFCPSCFTDLHQKETGEKRFWHLVLEDDKPRSEP